MAKRDSSVFVRCTPEERSEWEAAAKKAGKSLEAWARGELLREASKAVKAARRRPASPLCGRCARIGVPACDRCRLAAVASTRR